MSLSFCFWQLAYFLHSHFFSECEWKGNCIAILNAAGADWHLFSTNYVAFPLRMYVPLLHNTPVSHVDWRKRIRNDQATKAQQNLVNGTLPAGSLRPHLLPRRRRLTRKAAKIIQLMKHRWNTSSLFLLFVICLQKKGNRFFFDPETGTLAQKSYFRSLTKTKLDQPSNSVVRLAQKAESCVNTRLDSAHILL